MQTTPLLISNLLRFGTTVHADSTVTTWKADGPEITTYGEVGKISARLANALRGMGITGDQRVGTFMWNNTEHL
ncbi:MAG: fatty acid--CoA ligase, partial [Allobranchiibius sp.]